MPYFLVDEKSIYDKLHQPGFHFLVFSDGKSDCREFKARIDKEYAELVDCQIIPLSPQAAEVFGADKSFGVLLRPDNHIGFITVGASPDELGEYLRGLRGNEADHDRDG